MARFLTSVDFFLKKKGEKFLVDLSAGPIEKFAVVCCQRRACTGTLHQQLRTVDAPLVPSCRRGIRLNGSLRCDLDFPTRFGARSRALVVPSLGHSYVASTSCFASTANTSILFLSKQRAWRKEERLREKGPASCHAQR